MDMLEEIRTPSKAEQKTAIKSYNTLSVALDQIHSEETEIEIEKTSEKIRIPLRALKLLGDILKAMGEGKPVSVVPITTELTTQKAAELLGCSRPYVVNLLENGKIAYTLIGKHRRIRYEDVINYKQQIKQEQKQHLVDIMKADEELGLYDS